MLDGKRIAILAEEGFEDSEIIVPMWGMKSAGAKVLIVGSGSKEIYQGKRGSVAIRVDTTADKVKAEDLDAIIIPGGRAPARMRQHKSMVELVRKADELGKIIAAVCGGPQLLGKIGKRRQDPRPVGNRIAPRRVTLEDVPCDRDLLGEPLHGMFLGVAVEPQSVHQGVGVVLADRILGRAEVGGSQGVEET